ncbi:MAG TPA: metalloregulator ArsR/SmtB family transcription factor [Chroococcidiopsis sp.]
MKFPDPDQILLTDVLYALSDPTRLQIVKRLAKTGEQTCCSFDFPIAKSTLSHHFKVLRDSGVVYTRNEGTQSFNSLRLDDLNIRFPGLLDTVLNAVERS